MYLHVGNNKSIKTESIVLILDLDSAMSGKDNTAILKRFTDEKKVVEVSEELPKTMIITDGKDGEKAILSPLMASTLTERIKKSGTGSSVRRKGHEHG